MLRSGEEIPILLAAVICIINKVLKTKTSEKHGEKDIFGRFELSHSPKKPD